MKDIRKNIPFKVTITKWKDEAPRFYVCTDTNYREIAGRESSYDDNLLYPLKKDVTEWTQSFTVEDNWFDTELTGRKIEYLDSLFTKEYVSSKDIVSHCKRFNIAYEWNGKTLQNSSYIALSVPYERVIFAQFKYVSLDKFKLVNNTII